LLPIRCNHVVVVPNVAVILNGKLGMNPMAPAIIQVNTTSMIDANNSETTTNIKTMSWPILFSLPGEVLNLKDAPSAGADRDVSMVIVPESVVAIRTFSNAIVEPLVRKVDSQLRASLVRDGLLQTSPEKGPSTSHLINIDILSSTLTFAQYDAIYSMGERRCEVHIELENGTHPW
jgi:hypothetical protein